MGGIIRNHSGNEGFEFVELLDQRNPSYLVRGYFRSQVSGECGWGGVVEQEGGGEPEAGSAWCRE